MEKTYRNSKQANVASPIVVVTNQQVRFNSGTLELRKGSKTGELIESFDVSSDKILISAREIIIQPSNPLPYETEIHMVMSDGFVVSTMNGSSFSGFDANGNKEFKFKTEDPIGKSLDGGVIISKENCWYVVISPEESEMSTTWTEFNKVIQNTQDITKTTGWYIPGYYEMQFYKNYLKKEESYWTNTEVNTNNSYTLNTSKDAPVTSNKSNHHLVRTFKKVNF